MKSLHYCKITFLQASKRYLVVARAMKAYEDGMYQEWLETVEGTLPGLLKRTVLTKPPPTPLLLTAATTPLPGDSRDASRLDFSHILPPRELHISFYFKGTLARVL